MERMWIGRWRRPSARGPGWVLARMLRVLLWSALLAGTGVAGSGVAGSGVAGSGVAGSGVAGSGIAGSGVAGSGVAGSGVAPSGAWDWPTASRVVVRPFAQPAHDYGPGHRGVDVAAEVGAWASAPADGVVAYAGSVGGRPVLTIDHGGGLVSTLDSVVPEVTAGDGVLRGQSVGVVGPEPVAAGHCGGRVCLHLGARLDGTYVDPLPYLSKPEWPVLLPPG